jgi:hypothetical protein
MTGLCGECQGGSRLNSAENFTLVARLETVRCGVPGLKPRRGVGDAAPPAGASLSRLKRTRGKINSRRDVATHPMTSAVAASHASLGSHTPPLGSAVNGAKLSNVLDRFFAPKGLEDSAQGFNPGNPPPRRCALKGRQIRCGKYTQRTS